MKKLVFIIILIAGGYYFFNSSEFPKVGDPVENAEIIRYGRYIVEGLPLTDLAISGENTVIEVYAPSCPACKSLKKWTTKMRELRPDVNIRSVNITDDFLLGGLSKKVKSAMKTDAICSTPHLVIIDKEGEILAQDDCKNKLGRQFFYRWIEYEIKKHNRSL